MKVKLFTFISIFVIQLFAANVVYADEYYDVSDDNEIEIGSNFYYYSGAIVCDDNEEDEAGLAEMNDRQVLHSYDVYVDEEKTGKTVKGCCFNDTRIEDLVSLGDIFNIYDMNFKFKPQDKVKIIGTKYRTRMYEWGTFSFNGENYSLGSASSFNKTAKYKGISVYKFGIYKDAELSSDLKIGYLGLYAFYIDGDLYVPVSTLYYLSAYYLKTFNMDDNAIYIKTLDYDSENSLIEKYLPIDEAYNGRKDYCGAHSYNTMEENAVWINRELFMSAYVTEKFSIDYDFEIGHSLDDTNAFDYCVHLYQGAYNVYLKDKSVLKFDYNDELDAYIIYNKDYDNLTEDDNTLRICAVSAHDGRLIYRY